MKVFGGFVVFPILVNKCFRLKGSSVEKTALNTKIMRKM